MSAQAAFDAWQSVELDYDARSAPLVVKLTTPFRSDSALPRGRTPYSSDRSFEESVGLFRKRQAAYRRSTVAGLRELRELEARAALYRVAESVTAPLDRRFNRVLKRTVDLLFSAVLLLLIAPVMTLIAVMIRLDSPGPVFYRAVRVGRDGKPFLVYRFRTVHLTPVEGSAPRVGKVPSSAPSLTRIGRIVRTTSLHTLPLMFNVLKGDMSLIGPLPLSLDEHTLHAARSAQPSAALEREWRTLRANVRPGLVSPASFRRVTSLREWMQIEVSYLRTWNLWTDMKLVLRSLPEVLAYRITLD